MKKEQKTSLFEDISNPNKTTEKNALKIAKNILTNKYTLIFVLLNILTAFCTFIYAFYLFPKQFLIGYGILTACFILHDLSTIKKEK